MNGSITSKNFKTIFTLNGDASFNSVSIAATSSEARKYLKKNKAAEPTDLFHVAKILEQLESALREYVLAKIGG